MATPEYLQQVIIAGRKRASAERHDSTRVGVFGRPSVTSLVWASLDLVTVMLAGVLALRFRVPMAKDTPTIAVIPDLFHSAPRALLFYLLWYSICLIFFMRSVFHLPDLFYEVLWAVWADPKQEWAARTTHDGAGDFRCRPHLVWHLVPVARRRDFQDRGGTFDPDDGGIDQHPPCCVAQHGVQPLPRRH